MIDGGDSGSVDGSSSRNATARGGAGIGVVGPGGSDDLCDTNVAAVAASLGAELTDKVGRKAKDKRGRRGGEEAAIGAAEEGFGDVLLLLGGGSGEVCWLRAAFKWGQNPSTAAARDGGHFCGLVGGLFFCLSFSLSFSLFLCHRLGLPLGFF